MKPWSSLLAIGAWMWEGRTMTRGMVAGLMAWCGVMAWAQGGGEGLEKATALTSGGFTEGIEGPACDAKGVLYCVSFGTAPTIGRVTADGRAEAFVTLPSGRTGNGIRFEKDGRMLVADYTGHNVLRVDPATREVTVVAHDARMNQPNDLAMAPDGTVYASDPSWARGTGQVWRLDRQGRLHLEQEGMGTTNGIEVSPDGRLLYVNESIQRNVWVFDIGRDGRLSAKRLFRKFVDHGFDGMRCDADGKLYITRHGKGTVVVLDPKGEVVREVDVLGKHPTNLCFGGEDRRTVYVTEAEKKRVVMFRADRAGRE